MLINTIISQIVQIISSFTSTFSTIFIVSFTIYSLIALSSICRNSNITHIVPPQEITTQQLISKLDQNIPLDPFVNVIHEYLTFPKNLVVLDLFEHDWEFYFNNWLKLEFHSGNEHEPEKIVKIKFLWANSQKDNKEVQLQFPMNLNQEFQSLYYYISHRNDVQALKNMTILNSIFKVYFDNSMSDIHLLLIDALDTIHRFDINQSKVYQKNQDKINLIVKLTGSVKASGKFPSLLHNFKFEVVKIN